MQTFSRYQTINLQHKTPNLSNETISIQQALTTSDFSSIRCFIIKINPSVTYESQGFSRTSTFVVIADQSTTAYLTVTNLKQDELKPEQSYTITKIRRKMFNGSPVLSTTIDTRIELSNVVNRLIFSILIIVFYHHLARQS